MKEMYGWSEWTWQTIRIGIIGGLMYATTLAPKIRDMTAGQKVAPAIGIGALVYICLLQIFNYFMFKIADCEAFPAYDSIMLLDDSKVISNIVGTLFFEKFEFEEMRDYLMERTCLLHKCRSKVSKKFGLWWW